MEDGNSQKGHFEVVHILPLHYKIKSPAAASPIASTDPAIASSLSPPDFALALALAELAAAEVAEEPADVVLAAEALFVDADAVAPEGVALLARLPATPAPVVALVETLATPANAAVRLPVTTPGPWLPLAVKYRLTADWLGN